MIPGELRIPATRAFLGPSRGFLAALMDEAGFGAPRKQAVESIYESLFDGFTGSERTLRIQMVRDSAGPIAIEIRNEGEPLDWRKLQSRLSQSQAEGIDLQFQNGGRTGQCIRVILAEGTEVEKADASFEELHSGNEVVIERLPAEEAHALTELFFRVYRYRYINDYVYYPEKLATMIRDGNLTSIVARTSDRKLMAHVGILRWNQNPLVLEAALGVVDPRYKNNGLFGKAFSGAISLIRELNPHYSVYDFVTNHAYSQRLVAKYGFSDLALFLGNQVSETQARLSDLGLGSDPSEMDRYSLLMGVGLGAPRPFGERIVLPTNIGESFGFLLKPLGLEWVPAPRFHPLSAGGEYSVQQQKEQRALVFDFYQPGRQALFRILEESQRALEEGTQYIAIDVPLDVPGIGQLYDLLAKRGFFMAGFIPHHHSSRLGFRFQFLTPTKVDFEAIKLHADSSKRLLKVVRENYERNSRR